MGFILRTLVTAAAVWFAAAIVPGMEVHGILAILGAGLVLGLVNAVVRPIMILLTLPFTIVTLGLFLLVVNGLCLWLASALVKGFEISGFWSALFGSIIVSLVGGLLSAFVSDRGRIVYISGRMP